MTSFGRLYRKKNGQLMGTLCFDSVTAHATSLCVSSLLLRQKQGTTRLERSDVCVNYVGGCCASIRSVYV
jgi:hypothetical protein